MYDTKKVIGFCIIAFWFIVVTISLLIYEPVIFWGGFALGTFAFGIYLMNHDEY